MRRRALPILVIAVLIVVAVVLWISLREAGAPPPEGGQLWTCPMHPSVIRSEPGQCPICGMDLIPLQETKSEYESEVEGHGIVEISPEKQQLIGVVTTRVERRPLAREVRTVGIVTVDEERVSDVHTKFEGWVERLYADETGRLLRRGEPLLTIYSPELVSTQEEYLLALRSRKRTKDSPFEEVRRSGDSMVAAARRRLELWDISDREIDELARTGVVKKALTLSAPSTGYIMEKSVVEGMRVMPGMALYRLADLSRVWVDVDIYEYEAASVAEGMSATLTTSSYSEIKLSGRVTYVYPTVDMKTRTLTARLEFPNPNLLLKPGMYGDVLIETPQAEALAIPEQAVLDSGTRKVVFVKEDEGTFVPREVEIGPRMAEYYPVLSGLAAGEEVVSSPNFLIDSESRFAAAMERMQASSSEMEHPH
ncbi:MAG: efflux RND transporter periplasmic adaptor subunit [Armatimonadetes bacterium]|nr:efflux RND transporter periplasmic adaptor subunit [Armatimonadota bacterium]